MGYKQGLIMALTYNDLATREDKQFHARCRRELGVKRYMELVPLAREAFEEGLKWPNEVQRNNRAMRLANQVFSSALTKANK